jgi:hypothetical protein
MTAIIPGLQEGLLASTPRNKKGSMFELSIKFLLDLELTSITSSNIPSSISLVPTGASLPNVR